MISGLQNGLEINLCLLRNRNFRNRNFTIFAIHFVALACTIYRAFHIIFSIIFINYTRNLNLNCRYFYHHLIQIMIFQFMMIMLNWKYIMSKYQSKLGCVFPMVADSLLPHAVSGQMISGVSNYFKLKTFDV